MYWSRVACVLRLVIWCMPLCFSCLYVRFVWKEINWSWAIRQYRRIEMYSFSIQCNTLRLRWELCECGMWLCVRVTRCECVSTMLCVCERDSIFFRFWIPVPISISFCLDQIRSLVPINFIVYIFVKQIYFYQNELNDFPKTIKNQKFPLIHAVHISRNSICKCVILSIKFLFNWFSFPRSVPSNAIFFTSNPFV